MYYDTASDKLNDSRLNDSKLNESSASGLRIKRKKTLEDYEFVQNENSKYQTSELGKGSYGVVKKVKDRNSGKIYAMKIMSKKAIFEYSNKENLKREINIQRGIHHPHIIRLCTYFEDSENVYLILEYAEHGSLFHYIRRKKKFSEGEAFVYFFQTCLGIDYLHKRGIIHRDLKPENLLLDEEGNIKICDFGWSAQTSFQRATFCGTIDYMAPEMIKNQPHDHRLDIWSLGVLLYEMLHGYAPFKGRSDQEKTMNISMNMPIHFDPAISGEVVDLIRSILQPAPVNRITMSGIFEHPWMKKSEQIYQIDIKSYVDQQDEQIREMKKAENNRLILSHQTSSKTEISDKSLNKGVQSLQVSRQVSTERSSGNNNKIITIQDNSSPLILSQKMSYEDVKKLSYNRSTKASESSSIGLRAETNTLNIEQLLKEHRMRHQGSQENQNLDGFKEENYETSQSYQAAKSNQFTSEYWNGLAKSSEMLSFSQQIPNEMEKKHVYTGGYGFRKDAADGHINQVYTQKQRSAQMDSPGYKRDMYSSDRKERVPYYYDASYRDRKVEGRANSSEKLYRSDMQGNKYRHERMYSINGPLYEESDVYEGFQRMSKISLKNREIGSNNQSSGKAKETGLFERILVGLGCIARDTDKVQKKYSK